MEKIRTAYKNKYHSYSIKFLYYPYDSAKEVTDSIKGTCAVNNDCWYYKIKSAAGIVEYMKSRKYFVTVNYANKVIMIDNSTVAKCDLWDINKVDSVLQKQSLKIAYTEKNGEGTYTITFTQGSWDKMKLVFNKERYTLDEIWLYSSAQGKIFGEPYKKPVIGIFYSSYSENIPPQNDFSENRYVQEMENGNFETVGTFKGFKLLNYVTKKT